jgi:hypothetical protein
VSGYRIEYGTSPGMYTSSLNVGDVTSYTVPNLVYGVRYYFVVRAYNAFGDSGPSNEVNSLPSTGFSDDPLLSRSHSMKATHITELRTRINALRARAGINLPSFPWTDSTLIGTQIKAIHITELRQALNEAYVVAQRSVPIYTDLVLVPGTTVIQAVHINELRTAVVALE